MPILSAYLAALQRDLLLVMRRKTEVLTALFFFVIVTTLLPLGIGPEPDLLRKIAPGAMWIAALLATLLGLQRLFAADHADGTLEQMVLSPEPLSVLIAGKITAHWLVCGLPLVLLAPVIGLQFDLSADAIGILMLTLLIGTPLLSFIGAIGAALTLGARGSALLVSLLVLPLYIPTLIFGAGAVEATASGLGGQAHLSMLGAIALVALLATPIATSAALRISSE